MNILKKTNVLLMSCVLAVAVACKKSAPPVSTRTPETTVQLPMPASRPAETATAPIPAVKDTGMERALAKRYAGKPAEKEAILNTMSQLDAQIDAEDRLAAINRRTMVTPAPADFKPESYARKVRLKLFLEKPNIRAGDHPRFRLEMTNVGREQIDYHEYRSSIFVKDGGLLDSPTIHFFLTDSQNKRRELLPSMFPPLSSSGLPPKRKITAPPSGLPAAEIEKWFKETNAMGQAHATFKVKLLPGETLHSIGDDDSPVENFKTLITEDDFDKPGIYRLHVELDDRPRPLSKRYIEFSLRSGSTLEQIRKWHEAEARAALGPASSNTETLEVTR